MITSTVPFYRQKPYITVLMTHFFVDVLNNGRTLLVALIAVALGLTNTQLGIVFLFYNVGNAVTQPFFGWLADRTRARWLVIGGIGWMCGFYLVAAVASDWIALISLTIASLGSGMFHPSGTMIASRASMNSRNQATSYFFLAGQMGLFVGPVVGGILLEAYGRIGFIALPLLALIPVLYGLQFMHDQAQPRRKEEVTAVIPATVPSNRWFSQSSIALILIILTSYTTNISLISFLPVLFTNLGYSPAVVGWLSGIYLMGSAVGGVLGGALADRFSGKWIIMGSLLAAILPLYGYLQTETMWQAVLLFVAGTFTGMPHTILVVQVQSLFPNRRAMASGLALGFMFFSGSVGSAIIGVLADQISLPSAMAWLACLPLGAAIAALGLKNLPDPA